MLKLIGTLCLPVSMLVAITTKAQDTPEIGIVPIGTPSVALGTKLPERFGGLYPVAALDHFPAAQEFAHVGFIADAQTWARVWEGFQPDSTAPPVDFSREIILYARGVDPVNHIGVFTSAVDENGVVRVSAFTTAIGYFGPIDEVVWSGVTMNRAGVRQLSIGGQLLGIPSVPEPTTSVLALFAGLGCLAAKRRGLPASRRPVAAI